MHDIDPYEALQKSAESYEQVKTVADARYADLLFWTRQALAAGYRADDIALASGRSRRWVYQARDRAAYLGLGPDEEN